MGHKSRIQKKKFECGHVGYGEFCHLCNDLKTGILVKDEIGNLKTKENPK